MKCAKPDCNRGIGLLAYRRDRWSKRLYCSRTCLNAALASPKQPRQKAAAASYFEWLFGQANNPRPKLAPAFIRVRTR